MAPPLSVSRGVQINGAVFHYDYADKQVLGSDNVPPFGTLNRLVNIPKSKVTGGEIQLILRPAKSDEVSHEPAKLNEGSL